MSCTFCHNMSWCDVTKPFPPCERVACTSEYRACIGSFVCLL